MKCVTERKSFTDVSSLAAELAGSGNIENRKESPRHYEISKRATSGREGKKNYHEFWLKFWVSYYRIAGPIVQTKDHYSWEDKIWSSVEFVEQIKCLLAVSVLRRVGEVSLLITRECRSMTS